MTATQPNGPLIKLQSVTKVFLTEEVETHALSGIELLIKEGEFLAIAGPSGSWRSRATRSSLRSSSTSCGGSCRPSATTRSSTPST